MGSNPGSDTALLRCTFGVAPMPLMVKSQPMVKVCGLKAATIMDNKPLFFGACSSPAHPVVASTGAPGPCLGPVQIIAPWIGSQTVRICSLPAVNKDSTLICNFGGQITINMAPAVNVKIG